jgi:hypothetical protein
VETWKAERVSDRTSDGHGRSPLQGFCEHFRGRQHGDLTLAERHRHVALVERHMWPDGGRPATPEKLCGRFPVHDRNGCARSFLRLCRPRPMARGPFGD